MSTRPLCAALAALALTLPVACGGVDTEEVAEVQAELYTEMADILADVHDRASLEAAKPELRELGAELAEHAREWKAQAQRGVSGVGDARAMAEHAQATARGVARVQEQLMRLAQDPALRDQLDELTGAMGEAFEQGLR